jgi:hypothetical protein
MEKRVFFHTAVALKVRPVFIESKSAKFSGVIPYSLERAAWSMADLSGTRGQTARRESG